MYLKLLTVLMLVSYYKESDSNCFEPKKEKPFLHFATKTPYRVIQNENDEKIHYPGCVPIRSWSIIRHGSRNPSRKQINNMKNILSTFKDQIIDNSQLCQADIENFKTWECTADLDRAKFLVTEGVDELIELAERMQRRFPALLSNVYDNSTYKFKFTATERTEKSAESFTIGLFGRQNIKQIRYPEALHKDPVLRFYKACDKWKRDVDKNPKSMEEINKFIASETVRNVIDRISLKSGISGLNASDINLMYTTCAFETAWHKRKISPWCTLFGRDDIKVMEFIQDLEYYYIDGYGHELTYKQACPAAIDMLSHLNLKSNLPNATFYFTHSGTILKYLAFLGLYKDEESLKHSDFINKNNRNWRVSKIDAFASNIMFITFDCDSRGPHVLAMHQERIIKIPGCPTDYDLCSYKTFLNVFKKDVENCRFDEMCALT